MHCRAAGRMWTVRGKPVGFSAERHAISRRVFFCAGVGMNYAKPPLTFEQQADQLIKCGMVGDRVLVSGTLRVPDAERIVGRCA